MNIDNRNLIPPERSKWAPLGFFIFGFFAVLFLYDFLSYSKTETVPYSQFLKHLDSGQISDVTISDSRIFGTLTVDPSVKKPFFTIPINDDTLVQKLKDKGVVFSGEPKSSGWGGILAWILPFILIYIFSTILFRNMPGSTPGGLLGFAKSKAKVFVEKDVSTSFADVAGIDEAKEDLSEIADFLRDPMRYKRIGGRAPKGILLIGPPGTGKTLLARALAGEAKVPFFSINGSEFIEMFVGLGAARVRDLFQDARNQAPCLIFIDEIDSLGKSRAYTAIAGSNDEREQTLHQLLAEMDGFDSSQGVILIAATNRPEVLDPALLRAGRFDRQILVPMPDQVGRVQVLVVHAKKIHLDPSVKLEQIAALTSGFSGADLANLVNEAALIAVKRNADQVTQDDFNQAIERIVAGLEHRKRLMNPEEKRRIAYHEMGHATALLALQVPEKVQKVSIIARGLGALGYTLQRPIEDRYVIDYNELIGKIAVLLAGRASEKVFFPTSSTGAADDLSKATNLAQAMVRQYGLAENLGYATFEVPNQSFLPTNYTPMNPGSYSDKTAQSIDFETKMILDEAFRLAMDSVKLNRNFINLSVTRLLEVETLNEKEIEKLWQENGKTLLTLVDSKNLVSPLQIQH